jgi:hypothetical protein
MFMLMGAVYLHRLPELEAQLGVSPGLFAEKLPHILVSGLVMAVPGAVAWAGDWVGRAALTAGASAGEGGRVFERFDVLNVAAYQLMLPSCLRIETLPQSIDQARLQACRQ